MKTFKILLMFLVGLPIFGSKLILYLILLLLCIPQIRNIRFKEYIYLFYILIVPMLICELLIFQKAPVVSISIFCSMIIGYSVREIKIKSIIVVLTVLIASQIFSFYSIVNYGYDLVPQYIYGESRHLVGVNALIQYRPSGIYMEPSNLAVYYIAILIILFLSKEKYKYKNVLIIITTLFSILTFSVISLVSLLIIIINYKRFVGNFIYKVIIAITSSLFTYHFVTSFVVGKVNLYNEEGLDNYSRFELVYKMIDNIGFVPENLIELGVSLDNGPIIYLLLFCGVYSIPIIFYIVKKSKNNTGLLLLLITKISITYPLLWVILRNNENVKSSNSN